MVLPTESLLSMLTNLTREAIVDACWLPMSFKDSWVLCHCFRAVSTVFALDRECAWESKPNKGKIEGEKGIDSKSQELCISKLKQKVQVKNTAIVCYHHFCESSSMRQCLAAEKSALSLKLFSASLKESCHFLFRSIAIPSIDETCPSINNLFPITLSLISPSLASTCHLLFRYL